MSLIITLVKHFWPSRWFAAMEQESKTSPGIVTGIIAIWITLLAGGVFYWNEARAARLWQTSMEQIVANNTAALSCTSHERRIGKKIREIERTMRLIEVTTDETDLRDLIHERDELERELSRLENDFNTKCIQQGI